MSDWRSNLDSSFYIEEIPPQHEVVKKVTIEMEDGQEAILNGGDFLLPAVVEVEVETKKHEGWPNLRPGVKVDRRYHVTISFQAQGDQFYIKQKAADKT